MPQNDKQFVSRGGIKLQAALDHFQIDVKDKVVLDVGSSTGGFVDCLLQNGAQKVYAVDTAYGELAWKLRNDPKVVVMERTNILHLEHLPGVKAHLEGVKVEDPERSRRVDLITIDAGWTKLELILPVVKKFLKPTGIIVALLKPHYEAQPLTRYARYRPSKHFKGGVIPEDQAEQIKDKVLYTISQMQFTVKDVMKSSILGKGGNQEYLILIQVAS